MTTFEFRDLFGFISEKVMIQLREHSTSVECRCLTLCVCVCVLVDSFFLGVETPHNKFSKLNGPVTSSHYHLHSSGTSTHSNRHTYLERMPIGPL